MKNNIKLATKIAKYAFKDKKDNGNSPYFLHCKKVAKKSVKKVNIILENNNIALITSKKENITKNIFIVGILHDLCEECPEWTIENLKPLFNEEIIEALILLNKNKNQDYFEYINNLKNNKYALIVKLSDLEHNMDVSRLNSILSKDIERFVKYNKAYNSLKELFLLIKFNNNENE